MEEYVIKGPKCELDSIPINEDLNLLLYNSLKDRGDKIALVDAVTGDKCTFYEIFQSSCLLANNLKVRGVKVGDVICICTENRIDFAIPIAAALYIGAILTPINPFFKEDELLHCLNITKPKYIFCSNTSLEAVMDSIKSCPYISEIILMSNSIPELKECNVNITIFSDLLKPLNSGDHVDVFKPEKLDPLKQTAIVLYSSGTTGFPKGVKLSHANITANFRTSRSKYGFDEKFVILGLPSFFHPYGYSLLINTLLIGMKIIVIPKFDETLFLSTIEKYKVTFLPAIPPIMVFLEKSPLVDKYDLSSVETILCGGAPCRLSVIREVLSRIGQKNFLHVYGMTELQCATITPYGSGKLDSGGKPAADVEGKVIDLQTGKALGPNCEGELCFRSTQMMQGYFNNEKATQEIIDSNGWLHTGDIGYYDDEGYFFIVDRLKELIKYKDNQVSPAELEAIILKCSDVEDVGVVGVPDELCCELPMAFVFKKPGSNITEEDVIEFVASKVSPQKHLRGGVKFTNSIPKTTSGKILRKLLKEQILKPLI